MVEVTSGSTDITMNKNGFGVLLIQHISDEDTACLIRKAYERGINFFDTVWCYSDGEKKVGVALEGIRDKVIVATKTVSTAVEGLWEDLGISLDDPKTGHVGIYQFHNPSLCPRPDDGTDLYEAMLEAKVQRKVKHIGITNHRLFVADEAIDSSLYETLQFPFCYLATDKGIKLVEKCRRANIGLIAMEALFGELINNSRAAYVYLARLDNVLPTWGVQRGNELDEFLSYVQEPPMVTQELEELIRCDREQLQEGSYRSCGYYMPYPVGVEINSYARMSLMIRRSPSETQLTPQVQEKIKLIEKCPHCSQYRGKRPYGLGTPILFEKNLKNYLEILDDERY